MSIVSIGINYKVAAIALREQLSFAFDNLDAVLGRLLSVNGIHEAVILSTCHRSEIYVVSDAADATHLLTWLAQEKAVARVVLEQQCYSYQDERAISHLMQVACGLDSMIIGEPQILGQLKQAFARANNLGAVGVELSRLFQRVFALAKKIRSHTAIGACPVSLASTSVKLARRYVGELSGKKVLIIGAGDTARLLAGRFAAEAVATLIVANRTKSRAQRLVQDVGGIAINLSEIPDYLPTVDVVITAVASTTPILHPDAITERQTSLLLIDLGVPRNINQECQTIANVKLFCIDDLRAIIQQGIQVREHAADQAQKMIAQETVHLMRYLRSLHANSTIKAYRRHVERIRAEVLHEAMQALNQGVPAAEVVKRLAWVLSNKLMHQPSVQLRKAVYHGRVDVLAMAQELLGIE